MDYWVWDSVVFDDGHGSALYVAGFFKSADGIVSNRVARWNGSSWSAVGTGMDGEVRTLAVYDDGTGPALYAGGAFSNAGGLPANRIAKWNGNTWSALGTGLNSQSLSMAVYDDGSGAALYVGGGFTTAGGITANRIAKWNGSTWSALGSGTGNGVDNMIWHLEALNLGSGSALYLSGEFTQAGGQPASRIAKWNGTTFTPLGSGLDNRVLDFVVHNDGSGLALYVGGTFTAAGSVAAGNIAKWNGSSWSAVGSGTNGSVYGLSVSDDGNGPALFAMGTFTAVGSTTAGYIARWDGLSWSPWPPASPGLNGWVASMATYDAGSGPALYIMGAFTRIGQMQARYIAKWKAPVWSDLTAGGGDGFDSDIWALATFNDGTGPALYAGGHFTEASGVAANRIAKWNGATWAPLGSGVNNTVWSLAVFNDGSGPALYAGGDFSNAGGASALHVAKWNGSSWSPVGTGLNSTVWKLKVLDDGSGPALYAAGSFSFAGQGGVAKWNGSSWSFLGSGMNGPVRDIEIYNAGSGAKLYAGGHFTQVDGRPANYLAAWNGSTWQSLPTELNFYVYSLKSADDGNGNALFVGGEFTLAGAQPIKKLAKWNGSSWLSVDDGFGVNAPVYAFASFDDGTGQSLYVGGSFSDSTSTSLNFIAKRTSSGWEAVDKGMNGSVVALATYDAGSGPALFAGGYFWFTGDVPSLSIARYSCNTAPSSADLAVTKNDGVSTTTPGATLTYTIVVSNVGAGPDPSANFHDTLPAQLVGCTYTSVASGGASGNTPAGTGSLAETLSLPPGSSVTYLMSCTVSASASGVLTNTASATSSVFDANLGNNTASDSNSVGAASGPLLQIPDSLVVAAGGSVEVPVVLQTSGYNLGATAFSIDYDQNCLDPDVDHNGVLDQITFLVPGFSASASFNTADTDGEIDISIADVSPPISALASGVLVHIRFKAICSPVGLPILAPVLFSTAPTPTFGDTQANNVIGTSIGGGVQILGGIRGDCNGDGLVTAADLTAVGYEIFDGDGDFWLDAPNPSYPGRAVGCDANASTLIQAADVTCTNLLIFGGSCGSSLALTGPEQTGTEEGEVPAGSGIAAPLLEVSTSFDGSLVWFRGRLARNGNGVSSLAFSLDLDPAVFDLSKVDSDLDGAPDFLRFPQGEPGLAFVSWNPGDPDGELDLLLADLSQQSLPEGILVEIGIPAAQPQTQGFQYSRDPAPSFGALDGGDLPGIAVLGTLLFVNGFESGDLSAWDLVVP